VDELVPLETAFTFHRYTGEVPPLEGLAINVTEVPAHTGLEEAVMLRLTGSMLPTVIVTELLVAGFPLTQLVREEIRIHLTTSLLAGT